MPKQQQSLTHLDIWHPWSRSWDTGPGASSCASSSPPLELGAAGPSRAGGANKTHGFTLWAKTLTSHLDWVPDLEPFLEKSAALTHFQLLNHPKSHLFKLAYTLGPCSWTALVLWFYICYVLLFTFFFFSPILRFTCLYGVIECTERYI